MDWHAKPWELDHAEVREAWLALTEPDNLDELIAWGDCEMNPTAREATDMAIQVCRERIKQNSNKT